MIYPVITIQQPWATPIVNGIKDVENRNWRLPDKYCNCTILVHASAKPEFDQHNAQVEMVERGLWPKPYEFHPDSMLTGSIIGAVWFSGDLWAFNAEIPSLWADDNHNDGKLHCWTIAQAQIIAPIPAKGKIRFWEFDYPHKIVWPKEVRHAE